MSRLYYQNNKKITLDFIDITCYNSILSTITTKGFIWLDQEQNNIM
jgi:hypothetical protein